MWNTLDNTVCVIVNLALLPILFELLDVTLSGKVLMIGKSEVPG